MLTLSWLRQQLVSVRDALDRRLHPRRQARATERLQNLAPESILFVCLGNVCRSPYGEWVLTNRGPDWIRVDSAGFIFPGRPPPDTAIEVARARGVDHSSHRSKVVSAELLTNADVVFVFDRFNVARLRQTRSCRMDRVIWLGDLDPLWSGKRAIIDPWGKASEDFHRTFERIERCLDRVQAALSPPDADSASQVREPLP